jgi:hypothetical protein
MSQEAQQRYVVYSKAHRDPCYFSFASIVQRARMECVGQRRDILLVEENLDDAQRERPQKLSQLTFYPWRREDIQAIQTS